MRCLLCHKNIRDEGNIFEVLFEDNLICHDCRSLWQVNTKIHYLDNVPVYSSWIYNDAFASALIQYKEAYDEALKDIFIHPFLNRLRRKFFGYTLLLMPSTKKKEEERGFSHLKEMFSSLQMDMLSPFYKIEEESQKNKSLIEREKMAHNIALKSDKQLPEKVLIVDDVLTTGSSLKGALKCLDKNKHRVKIYTVSIVGNKSTKRI